MTLPLAPAIIDALHGAVDEMADAATFHGYAPDLGYSFLRETIAKNDFAARGCEVYADEIFVSDGANVILEIFRRFSAWIIRLQFAIRSIQCMWIPM